mmetsp:Transcript_30941/g.79451  ORF Transcript_30941/g.79451 Transcript_30941/m.79451 type:complete len:323 (-) Transcript_30941:453-1421(-)
MASSCGGFSWRLQIRIRCVRRQCRRLQRLACDGSVLVNARNQRLEGREVGLRSDVAADHEAQLFAIKRLLELVQDPWLGRAVRVLEVGVPADAHHHLVDLWRVAQAGEPAVYAGHGARQLRHERLGRQIGGRNAERGGTPPKATDNCPLDIPLWLHWHHAVDAILEGRQPKFLGVKVHQRGKHLGAAGRDVRVHAWQGRDSHHLHAGGDTGLKACRRILHHQALLRLHPHSGRHLQVNVRRGLAVHHLIPRDDHREALRQALLAAHLLLQRLARSGGPDGHGHSVRGQVIHQPLHPRQELALLPFFGQLGLTLREELLSGPG